MARRFYYFLIESNIYISLAAVLLTVQAQIQLGMQPHWHPYLFIIFFATMLEYNLHRLITLTVRKEILGNEKYEWLRNHTKLFYGIMLFSLIGFFIAFFLAKEVVVLTLLPIGLLTIFYSIPIYKKKQKLFRLREISVLKIFLIAAVWALSTVMLPIIQSEKSFDTQEVMLLLTERMLFVFAITIPFDIRDMEGDIKSNLKTIPIILGEKKSIRLAALSLCLFFALSFFHYYNSPLAYILPALLLSASSTLLFLFHKKIKKRRYYYYSILDGTMFYQGLMVIASYYYLCVK
ncbi:MAG: UbiA family prenyltransferase [Bacteroidetes bacterium]|nr:UbiA family prenyltransferase [Bacteroidota bacterium]